MDKEFVPHQPSLDLEELGFDEPCLGYHLCKNSALGVYLEIITEWIDLFPYDSSSCKAPTFSQAFRWFREKYNLHSTITLISNGDIDRVYMVMIDYIYPHKAIMDFKEYGTYEEAELECLKKLIEIVKEKK
jgi:hypothetical protein